MATIQKRGGSYLIRVSCGYDVKGKQIIRSKTWKPERKMTPNQLEKELNRQAVIFEEECNSGYQSGAVKFEAFAEQWFDEYAKPNLRNTTYERMLMLRKRVYAALGHMRMDRITPRDIQIFVNSMLEDGANEKNGKPLAPKTVRHNLELVSDVFAYAVRMGVVRENPCSKVVLPKNEQTEKEIYRESSYWRVRSFPLMPIMLPLMKYLLINSAVCRHATHVMKSASRSPSFDGGRSTARRKVRTDTPFGVTLTSLSVAIRPRRLTLFIWLSFIRNLFASA